MESPRTPKKQTQPQTMARLLPTPPRSATAGKGHQNTGYQQGRDLTLPIHSRSPPEETTTRNHGQSATHKLQRNSQSSHTLSSWLHDPVDEDKRRKRMANFFHCLWLSDDEELGDPFHDSDDSDWDPCVRRPKTWVRRTEKLEPWQPKIGDEGIEDEEDLNMLVQAREEHKARALNYERQENRFIAKKLSEGIALADVDMTEFLLGPRINLNDDDDANETNQTQTQIQATKKASSSKTTKDQNMEEEKGEEKKTKRGKARVRTNHKRKRSSRTIDTTYRYEADVEDEPRTKKRHRNKKTGHANVDVDASSNANSPPWKAHTRSAARCARGSGN